METKVTVVTLKVLHSLIYQPCTTILEVASTYFCNEMG